MKRLFDILLAALCLVIFAPLMALVAVALFFRQGCPIIYSQERIGRHGKPFLIYKFRTMTSDAEATGERLTCPSETHQHVTPIGQFLRTHHLDELPQFWNVLVGDMSFVGYRPERAFYIAKIMEHDARYEQLYAIRPGITSYATLHNGYTDSLEKMLKRLDYDLAYLEQRSLAEDFRILGMTFVSIVLGKKF
ncbi:MAG: sugar transferase [Bacteroidaceae bacterium]|nr:sugar transferase [Bacteroidaceae bacterium]